MKRIISFILALSMIFSLGITAFADVTYSADKNSIKKGETVAVTINNGEKMENITSFEYRLYFDSELFKLKSSEIGTANTSVKVTSVAKEDTKGTYYGVSLVDATSEGLEVAEGVIATLVFEAIKEVETASEASFELVKKSVMDTSWNEIEAGNVSGNGVSITVLPEIVEVTGITLNKETLYLGIGEADILKATVLPEDATDKTVVWSSSAEGVATVDQNGSVTAVAAGTATITAKTGDFEAICEVTVIAEENTVIDVSSNNKPHKMNHVSQITLSGVAVKEYNCTAGDEMTVDIVLDSNTAKDAVFTIDMDSAGSRAEKYPMVYDGVGFDSNGTKEVTLTNGGAVFSVTTTGQYSSSKSETITWNFNISIDGVQAGLSINPEQLELVNIGSTATLTANNAPGEVVWESSDENVVTVDEGVVTAIGFGTATITATSGEQTADCLVNVIEETVIDVSTVKKPHATWGYLSTIIVKGMVSVKEWDNDDTTVNISLASDTASDASFELTFSGVAANMNNFDIKYNDESYKTKPLTVTLADGKAEITLKVIGTNTECEWKINITVAEDDEISTNRTTIKTGAEFVEGAADAWCEEIIVVGPAVTDSKVTEYSETDRKIVVLLDEATDDSASVKLEFVDAGYRDGSLSLEYTLEKPYSFNLENGKKTVEFETDGNAVTRREYSIILKNSNNAPAIKDGIENVTADWENQATYSVKLSDIFVDADNDALDYSVSVDGTEYPFIGEEWSYKAETVGEHVIVFTASDGLVVSEEYKVVLNVFNKKVFFNVDFYVPEGIALDFYVNAGYDGTVGDVLGEKLEAVKDETADGFVKYTVAVPENVATVSFRGKDAEGNSWGGATAAVAENCDAIKICKVKGIIETLIDGETPKAEDAEFRFVNADGNYAAKGDSFVEGEHLGYRFLLADGQYTYQAAAAETGSLAEKYGVREKGPEAVSAENAEVKVFALPMCLKNYYTVTAPEGSVVHTGKMNYYFKYYFFEAFREINNGDGTVTFELEVLPYKNEDGSVGGSDFIRVQHPDGVTYWDYETKLSNGKELVITEEMLFIGEDDGFNADTIFHNFEEYEMDVADIYLNVNKEMYINLDINKTFKLNVFRNWMAINNISNGCVALPDVTYTVIDENGNASDVVSVKVDKYNSSVADIVANKEGTAIVLVTYDAMYHNGAAHGQLGNGAVTPEKFSAIWPENTGVFVITVGADGSSIVTNMDTDAEHDPIYYVGNKGAEFAFTPEEGCKVSVARATLTANSLTYNGFVTEGVTVNEETGEVTVTGLTQGRHIIRVEKNGVATYQIITTKQTTMVITDNEGNVITEESEVMPGTELKVQFGDIYNPMNKLSGIYNTNCGIQYDGEDGTQFGGDNTGFGDYTFASRYESHAVTIKVPEDWIKDTYTLVGSLHIAGFGSSGGGHRGVCLYETGKAMDTDAPGVSGNPGVLPTITINVHQHSFEEIVKEELLVSAADCENAAVYYKSCECGEVGTETFSYSEELGHKDDNKDHVCDNNCGIAQGEHADTNKDHACDYGCSVAIGSCEDANKDHVCDYGCDKTYGTHEDTDKDHDCDYGCSVNIGTCEDTNKDHACDYGCGKACGEHKDSADDKDHVCDYGCRAVLEECSGGVANCTEKATCSVCGEKYGDIDSDAHAWTVSYDWSEDGKACTATKACANNAEHNLIAEATVTSVVAKEVNCSVMGDTQYTATFAADWAETQVTVRTDIAIDEDAHEWGEWKVVKEASYTEEGSKKRVCKNDESHVETETIAKLVPTATEKAEGPDDTKEYVVAYQEGVVMVPAGLENEYPNQQAVKDALKAKVENGDLDGEVNLVFREVTVGYYENGAFVPVSNREFFENGKTIDILLKYPEGADKNDKFEVYHLRDDGVIEKCKIKAKTDDGLVIEVGSLSPFAIAYESVDNTPSWPSNPGKPSKPSNKPNPGITIITPEDEKEEANPNTGAPVFDMTLAGVVVLAATAIVLGKKNK